MDSVKKTRSSFQIKRSAASMGVSAPVGAVVGTRQKRRISFSGKMSVREFCGEEEPQTWNNSYELSDHANASGPEASAVIAAGTSRPAVTGSTDESDELRYAADKENIHWDPRTASATVSKALMPRCEGTVAAVGHKMQQIDVLTENKIGVTLLDSENDRIRHLRSKPSHLSWSGSDNEHPSITFSIYEHDYRMLQTNVSSYSEQTEDYLRELYDNDCVTKHGSVHKDKRETVIFNEEMVESMCDNYDVGEGAAASQTICMNERIEAEDEKCTVPKRLTLRAVEDMQVSLVTENGQRNGKYTQNNDTTSFTTAMEVESPSHEVLRERLLVAESMSLVQMSESFNNSLKSTPMNADELGKDCNLKNHAEISMDISSLDENNIARVNEPGVMALIEADDELQEHIEMPKSELKLAFEGEPEVNSGREKVNDEKGLMHVANGPLAGTTKGRNLLKVVVVRKMCTPTISVEQSDLKKNRFRQHKATVQSAVKEVRATTAPEVGIRNLNNISLNNAEDISVASDHSSPLFPPEFVSSTKKLNFRQLNDEIERGKIRIYSELGAKVPSARRKSVGKQLFAMPNDGNSGKHAKESEAIERSADDIRVSLCGNSSIQAKNALRLSEACNMFDNTSFLIKAKLGDETASRNSSSSNRRETIHFNEDVDVTMELDEKTLHPECVERDKPECCNEGDAEERNSSFERIVYVQKNQGTPTHQKRNADSRRTILEVQDISLNETDATINVTNLGNLSGSKDMECETGTGNTMRMDTERTKVTSTTKGNGDNENPVGHSSITPNFRNADKSVRNAEEGSRKRRTIIFADENNIPLDESSQINQNADFQEKSIHEESSSFKEENFKDEYKLSVKPLNAAKVVLMRQNALRIRGENMEDSLTQKLNETRAATFGDSKKKPADLNGHEASMDVSPVIVSDQQRHLRRLYEGTPHRSVIEFECLELEAEQEQQRYEETETENEERHHKSLEMSIICCETEEKPSLKLRRQTTHDPVPIEMDVSGLQPLENENVSNVGFVSPIVSALIRKRLTANLTPNSPVSKKRQTLVFNNCGVEESVVYIGDQVKEIEGKQLSLNTIKHEARAVPPKSDNDTENRSKEGDTDSNCNMNRIAVLQGTVGVEREVNNTAAGNNISNVYQSSPTATSIGNIKGDVSDLSKNTGVSLIPVRINSTQKNGSIKCCLTPKKWDESDTNHSLDTIQIPRRATAFIQQQEQSIKLPASGNVTAVNQTLNESGKQQSVFFTFEANPITISDVSVHYLAQQKQQKTNRAETDVQGEDLCDLHANTAIKFLSDFERDYLSDIDKTRLTLVESLISESVEDDVEVEHDKVLGECECDEVNDSNCLQKAVENRGNTYICRKCRNFQEILDEENMTSIGETLVLPTLPSLPCPGVKRLLRLRQRPAIADVHEYWRRKSLERSLSPENLSSTAAQLLEMEDKKEDQEPADDFSITALMTDIQRIEVQLKGVNLADCSFRKHPTFVQRLDEMLNEKSPNWVFDYQMQHRGVFIFSHKLLITFIIVMLYEETNLLGDSIRILNIEVQNSRVAKKNWKPIDFFMDFQFRLELPVDLKSACMSSDEHGITKILQDIDGVCVDVVLSGNYLWRLVCSEQASLMSKSAAITSIRLRAAGQWVKTGIGHNSVRTLLGEFGELDYKLPQYQFNKTFSITIPDRSEWEMGSAPLTSSSCQIYTDGSKLGEVDTGRTIVRKVVREVVTSGNYQQVKKSEYKVKLANLKTLSFKDIIFPPLHAFSEGIQFLPIGLDFLHAFLRKPDEHLKKTENEN